jgi:hypothetical protein
MPNLSELENLIRARTEWELEDANRMLDNLNGDLTKIVMSAMHPNAEADMTKARDYYLSILQTPNKVRELAERAAQVAIDELIKSLEAEWEQEKQQRGAHDDDAGTA